MQKAEILRLVYPYTSAFRKQGQLKFLYFTDIQFGERRFPLPHVLVRSSCPLTPSVDLPYPADLFFGCLVYNVPDQFPCQ
jgi:hypothetical protein